MRDLTRGKKQWPHRYIHDSAEATITLSWGKKAEGTLEV